MNTHPICYKCVYRRHIPGDHHTCCAYPGTITGLFDFFSLKNFELAQKLNISANPHGVKNGWFLWPINFDPIWLENCDGFLRKE